MNKWDIMIDGKKVMDIELEEKFTHKHVYELIHRTVVTMKFANFNQMKSENVDSENIVKRKIPFWRVSLIRTMPNGGVKSWIYNV